MGWACFSIRQFRASRFWFGVRPEVTPELRKAVLCAIEARERAHT